MTGAINIAAVFIANAMGIVLLLVVSSSARWKLREPGAANSSLRLMVVLAISGCLVDIIAAACDSTPGAMAFTGVYLGNLFLFVLVLVLPIVWVIFLSMHLNGHVAKRQRYLLSAVAAIGTICLLINLIVPIAFYIDENNIYQRGSLYFVFAAMQAITIIDSVLLYFKSSRKSAQLKVFPVHYFLMPVLIGVVIQTLAYGVSTIWPFSAISVCGVIVGLQNEEIFRDQLTGLFNRTYLDRIVGRELSKGKQSYTGIMIDLNGFKDVNDTYGHAIGDLALKSMAKILNDAANGHGIAARYAGDEFIVVLATQNDDEIEAFKSNLRLAIEAANAEKDCPYTLSASMGSCKLRSGVTGLAESFDLMDALMYDDKRAYYAEHHKR